ncbi:hypothetical protein CDD83_9759 [Cordyceps sp. RAO-2017]|nr:hypothetical protein CDD83_9759 [Cordyceps sp. RAO-2017]
MASRKRAIRCAEAVALLDLLHVQDPPSENPVPGSFTESSGEYTLSFECERYLCRTLAFLSSMKDDKNHIPALCLQECPGEEALNVVVAVNEEISGDGLQTLRNIEQGFERIFTLLSRPQRKYTSVLESLGHGLQEPKFQVLKIVSTMPSSERARSEFVNVFSASRGDSKLR